MEWDGQYDGLRESRAFFRPMRIPEQCSGEMLSAELQREFCFEPLDESGTPPVQKRLDGIIAKALSADIGTHMKMGGILVLGIRTAFADGRKPCERFSAVRT